MSGTVLVMVGNVTLLSDGGASTSIDPWQQTSRVSRPRPRLCLDSYCVRYNSSNEMAQAILLLIVMFIRNYDGFASPPRVSRPRRDFFSKLIPKVGILCQPWTKRS